LARWELATRTDLRNGETFKFTQEYTSTSTGSGGTDDQTGVTAATVPESTSLVLLGLRSLGLAERSIVVFVASWEIVLSSLN
jgi:hypothetical protein